MLYESVGMLHNFSVDSKIWSKKSDVQSPKFDVWSFPKVERVQWAVFMSYDSVKKLESKEIVPCEFEHSSTLFATSILPSLAVDMSQDAFN